VGPVVQRFAFWRLEHQPRARAVGRGLWEPLVDQVEGLLGFGARYRETVVGRPGQCHGADARAGQHGEPDRQDEFAFAEGELAEPIEVGSHAETIHRAGISGRQPDADFSAYRARGIPGFCYRG
jgi:hypothetical protein